MPSWEAKTSPRSALADRQTVQSVVNVDVPDEENMMKNSLRGWSCAVVVAWDVL